MNPDAMKVFYATHRSTANASPESGSPVPEQSGLYRNPLPLSNGRLAAIHTTETRPDRNEGTGGNPSSRYDFRLKLLKKKNGYWIPDVHLTDGIFAELTWWAPDYRVTYSGPLWELDPVEVRPRPRPTPTVAHLPAPELEIFEEESVDPLLFQQYLRQRDLALIVTRDVTGRDAGDQQQPFNLRVPGGKQTTGSAGKVYDVTHLQLFQADLLRGIGLRNSAPRRGRRVLAREMHEQLADNTPAPGAPNGSVRVASDGSIAAIVPARRAMTWELIGPEGDPVVRERYWITFQPGEIRSCANCHGVNRKNQAGLGPSMNPPEALRELLRQWKQNNEPVVGTITEQGQTTATVTFKRQSAAANLKHHVEFSDDLRNWIEGSSYQGDQAVHSGTLTELGRVPGAHETITLKEVAPGNRARFFRVRVEPNE